MSWTTNDLVRSESGFDNNSDITEASLTSYVNMAHGEVKGFVARIYDMAIMEASAIFTGSQAEDFLEGVETLWGSGLMLIKEYGGDAGDSDKNGYKKLELAKAMLMDLEAGKVILLDTANAEFERVDVSTGGVIVAGGADEDDEIFSRDIVF